MNMMKKLTALVLALVLTMSLAACGGSGMSAGSRTDGIYYEATGVSPDAVLMRVNGMDVTAESYFYQLYNMAANIVMYCGSDGFDGDSGDGTTFAELIMDYTMQSVKEIGLVQKWAKEYDITLSAAELDAITAELDAYEGEYGEFGFAFMGLTRASMEEMYRVFAQYDLLQESIYVEDGALAPTEEDLLAYAKETGLMKADHILLGTTDPLTGEALSAETVEAQLTKAHEILAQLEAAEDVEALFAELGDAYSEDPGRAYYPDGYVFGEGEMVAEFENAAKLLVPGNISGVVESPYGYHILLRKELTAEDVLALGEYFQYLLKQETEEAVVEYSDLYHEKVENLDIGEFYNAVTLSREELYAEYMLTQESAEGEESAEDGEEAVG